MRDSKKIPCKDRNRLVSEGTEFVEDLLKQMGTKGKERIPAVFLAEELLLTLAEHAPEDGVVTIAARKVFGRVVIRLEAEGENVDLNALSGLSLDLDTEEMNADTEQAIRGMVLKSFEDRLKYRHAGKRNVFQIAVGKPVRTSIYLTIGALVLGIVAGILMKVTLSSGADAFLNKYLFSTLKTLFMNALKLVVGPVVFFSIADCMAGFSDFREFGRLGGKIIGFYMLTTVIASTIGVALGTIFKIGSSGMMIAGEVTETAASQISLYDTLMAIVPSNFVRPFLEADMLAIIFISVLLGISAGRAKTKSAAIRTFLTAGNELFLGMTSIIMKMLPLVIFSSMASMMLTNGKETLLSLLAFVGVVILGLLLMVTVYSILLAVLARVNPLKMLKKAAPALITVFSLASSSAAMPITMELCGKLGVPRKVSSFSIPLGSTINMDGSCIYLAIASLFLARIYGVSLTPAELLTLVGTIILLSVGAPSIPGSAFICLSALLVHIGVPVEAAGIIMGIDALMGMFRTVSNTLGDVVAALVVSKSEKLLDTRALDL